MEQNVAFISSKQENMKERKATGQKMKTRTKKGFCRQRMKPSGLLTKRMMNGIRQMLPAEKSRSVEKDPANHAKDSSPRKGENSVHTETQVEHTSPTTINTGIQASGMNKMQRASMTLSLEKEKAMAGNQEKEERKERIRMKKEEMPLKDGLKDTPKENSRKAKTSPTSPNQAMEQATTPTSQPKERHQEKDSPIMQENIMNQKQE